VPGLWQALEAELGCVLSTTYLRDDLRRLLLFRFLFFFPPFRGVNQFFNESLKDFLLDGPTVFTSSFSLSSVFYFSLKSVDISCLLGVSS